MNNHPFASLEDKPYDWGYVLGTMASDGSKPYYAACKSRYGKIYHYPEITLAVTDKEFADTFLNAIQNITGKRYALNSRMNRKSKFWYTKICRTHFIEYLSTLTNWGTYTWRVPSMVICNRKLAKGFLLGFFDGDGTVQLSRSNIPRYRSVPKLEFSSVNMEGLQDVQKLLALFNIKSTLSSRPNRHIYILHHLKISQKLDIIKYLNVIGITLQRKHQSLLRGIEAYLQNVKWQNHSKEIAMPQRLS